MSCFINSLASNSRFPSPTGEADSVLISYDDLRLVNSKLIDLEYTKKSNNKLKQIISNDSLLINTLEIENDALSKNNKKLKNQRNFAISTGGTSLIVLILLFLL